MDKNIKCYAIGIAVSFLFNLMPLVNPGTIYLLTPFLLILTWPGSFILYLVKIELPQIIILIFQAITGGLIAGSLIKQMTKLNKKERIIFGTVFYVSSLIIGSLILGFMTS